MPDPYAEITGFAEGHAILHEKGESADSISADSRYCV